LGSFGTGCNPDAYIGATPGGSSSTREVENADYPPKTPCGFPTGGDDDIAAF